MKESLLLIKQPHTHMKHLSIASLVLAILFISCKKDRVCSCDVSTLGTRTIASRSASVTYSLNLPLPIPIPIPPLELIQGRDTTITSSFSYSNPKETTYDKVSKKMANAVCPATSEESYNDNYTTIIPGSATITVTENGRKTYTCKIE